MSLWRGNAALLLHHFPPVSSIIDTIVCSLFCFVFVFVCFVCVGFVCLVRLFCFLILLAHYMQCIPQPSLAGLKIMRINY